MKWYKSPTFWGSFIAIVVGVLSAFGLNVEGAEADLQAVADGAIAVSEGGGVEALALAIGSIVGGLIGFFGRLFEGKKDGKADLVVTGDS